MRELDGRIYWNSRDLQQKIYFPKQRKERPEDAKILSRSKNHNKIYQPTCSTENRALFDHMLGYNLKAAPIIVKNSA